MKICRFLVTALPFLGGPTSWVLGATDATSHVRGSENRRLVNPDTDPISSGQCFSGTMKVPVKSQGLVAMKDLRVGDEVLSASGFYQPVYAFGHHLPKAQAEFVEISTLNNVLELTMTHMVYLQGGSNPVRAETVKVGDVLVGQNENMQVTKVNRVTRKGLYAPFTPDGTIVVNGIHASIYSSLEGVQEHALCGYYEHATSHFGISPFRLLCSNDFFSPGHCQEYNTKGVPIVLEYFHRLFDWAMSLPVVLKNLTILIYFSLTFVSWLVECLLSVSVMGPLIMLAVPVVWAKVNGVQAKELKTV